MSHDRTERKSNHDKSDKCKICTEHGGWYDDWKYRSPPNSMSLAGSAQVLAWGKSRRNRSAHESFSGEGADPQVSRSWTSSTMSKKC